jgi:hypothetical protein
MIIPECPVQEMRSKGLAKVKKQAFDLEMSGERSARPIIA